MFKRNIHIKQNTIDMTKRAVIECNIMPGNIQDSRFLLVNIEIHKMLYISYQPQVLIMYLNSPRIKTQYSQVNLAYFHWGPLWGVRSMKEYKGYNYNDQIYNKIISIIVYKDFTMFQ